MSTLAHHKTLSDLLKRAPLSPDRVNAIAVQLCRCVGEEHDRGVIHGCFTPATFVVDEEGGEPHLTIAETKSASLPSSQAEIEQLARSGQLSEKLPYMSPETCRGWKPDERSDVYSVGCILYECASGRKPVNPSDPMRALSEQMNTLPPRLTSTWRARVPESLEKIVFKAIQKEPTYRFSSMAQLKEYLDGAATGKKRLFDLDVIKFRPEPSRPLAARVALIVMAIIALAIACLVIAGQR